MKAWELLSTGDLEYNKFHMYLHKGTFIHQADTGLLVTANHDLGREH